MSQSVRIEPTPTQKDQNNELQRVNDVLFEFSSSTENLNLLLTEKDFDIKNEIKSSLDGFNTELLLTHDQSEKNFPATHSLLKNNKSFFIHQQRKIVNFIPDPVQISKEAQFGNDRVIDLSDSIKDGFVNKFGQIGASKDFAIQYSQKSLEKKRQEIESPYNKFIANALTSLHHDLYSYNTKLDDISSIVQKNLGDIKGQDETLFKYDLFNTKNLLRLSAAIEILEKNEEQAILNSIPLLMGDYNHYLNYLLSLPVLALCFYNFRKDPKSLEAKQKSSEKFELKIERIESVKSNEDQKNSDSKVEEKKRDTLINLTGIFSEIDFDFVTRYSPETQFIQIYDPQTGGPDISSNSATSEENTVRVNQEFYTSRNKKAMFIPLETSNKQSYYNEDLYLIFENFVLPALRLHKPERIILNIGVNLLGNDPKGKISLDSRALGKIVHSLKTITESSIFVFPTRIAELSIDRYVDMLQHYKKSLELKKCESKDNKEKIGESKSEESPTMIQKVSSISTTVSESKSKKKNASVISLRSTMDTSNLSEDEVIEIENKVYLFEKRLSYIVENYARCFQKSKIFKAFSVISEVLIDQKKFKLKEAVADSLELNPKIGKTLFNLKEHYQYHQNYQGILTDLYKTSFLLQEFYFKKNLQEYTKKFISYPNNKDLIGQAKELFTKEKFPLIDIDDSTQGLILLKSNFTNSLTIFDSNNNTYELSLFGVHDEVNKENIDIYFDKYTAYHVVYEEHSVLILALNAILKSSTPSYKNYLISVINKQATVREIGDMPGYKDGYLKNPGIAYFDKHFYVVQGTFVGREVPAYDTESILMFSEQNKQWSVMKIDGNKKPLARHSVTACAFFRDNEYTLAVFGGKMSKTRLEDESFNVLLDYIEVFTRGPKESEWTYKKIDKTLSRNDQDLTQPFYYPNVYALYDEKKYVYLIGGKMERGSVYEKLVQIHKIDADDWKAKSMNSVGNSLDQKSLAFTTEDSMESIGDVNKNMKYKVEKGEIELRILFKNSQGKFFVANFEKNLSKISTTLASFSEPKKEEEKSKSSKDGLIPSKNISVIQIFFDNDILNARKFLKQVQKEAPQKQEELDKIIENYDTLKDSIKVLQEKYNLSKYLLSEKDKPNKPLGLLLSYSKRYSRLYQAKDQTQRILDGNKILNSITEPSKLPPSYFKFGTIASVKKIYEKYQALPEHLNKPKEKIPKDKMINLQEQAQPVQKRELSFKGNEYFSLTEIKSILKKNKEKPFKYCINPSANSITILYLNDLTITVTLILQEKDQIFNITSLFFPCSLKVFNGAVIGFVDDYIKYSQPALFETFGHRILFGDLDSALKEAQDGKATVIMKPAFGKFNRQLDFIQRGLYVDEDVALILGGFLYSSELDQCMALSGKGLKIDFNENDDTIVETEMIGELEERCSMPVSCKIGGEIYACAGMDPKYLDIFKQNGAKKKVVGLKDFLDKKISYRVQLCAIRIKDVDYLFMLLIPEVSRNDSEREMKALVYDPQHNVLSEANLKGDPEYPYGLRVSGTEMLLSWGGEGRCNEFVHIRRFLGENWHIEAYNISIVPQKGKKIELSDILLKIVKETAGKPRSKRIDFVEKLFENSKSEEDLKRNLNFNEEDIQEIQVRDKKGAEFKIEDWSFLESVLDDYLGTADIFKKLCKEYYKLIQTYTMMKLEDRETL